MFQRNVFLSLEDEMKVCIMLFNFYQYFHLNNNIYNLLSSHAQRVKEINAVISGFNCSANITKTHFK